MHPNFLAVDIETTSLDWSTGGRILEVAMLVLDDQLIELAHCHVLIRPTRTTYWEPWCIRQHTASGLLQRAQSGMTAQQASRVLRRFLDVQFPGCCDRHEQRPVVFGNSPHFDRAWLQHLFPEVARRLHHRHADVTSVRQFLTRICGLKEATVPDFEPPHVALEDIRASVSEMRRFRGIVARMGDIRLPCGHPPTADVAYLNPSPGATHACLVCEREARNPTENDS